MSTVLGKAGLRGPPGGSHSAFLLLLPRYLAAFIGCIERQLVS